MIPSLNELVCSIEMEKLRSMSKLNKGVTRITTHIYNDDNQMRDYPTMTLISQAEGLLTKQKKQIEEITRISSEIQKVIEKMRG